MAYVYVRDAGEPDSGDNSTRKVKYAYLVACIHHADRDLFDRGGYRVIERRVARPCRPTGDDL